MEQSNNLSDFGTYLFDNYKMDYQNNLISIRNVYFSNLTYDNDITAINGSVILDSIKEYAIEIHLSKKALNEFLKFCNDFIPFDEWLSSNNKNIPLHITETIVFDFIGELILNKENNTIDSSIQCYAKHISVKEISVPIFDSREPTFTQSDFKHKNTFITLPKYFLKQTWLDGWFDRELHKNPRRNPITKDSMSDSINLELLDNVEAENYSKIKTYEAYLSIGYSEEESRKMAGL